MTDKKRMGNNPLDDWVKPTTEEKKPIGRPRTIDREYTKTSQEGLKDNWTRYTVIIREDLLDQLKDYAYTDRRTMKAIINEMIEDYLENKEIIERPDK